jgi:hypothetical protein
MGDEEHGRSVHEQVHNIAAENVSPGDCREGRFESHSVNLRPGDSLLLEVSRVITLRGYLFCRSFGLEASQSVSVT